MKFQVRDTTPVFSIKEIEGELLTLNICPDIQFIYSDSKIYEKRTGLQVYSGTGNKKSITSKLAEELQSNPSKLNNVLEVKNIPSLMEQKGYMEQYHKLVKTFRQQTTNCDTYIPLNVIELEKQLNLPDGKSVKQWMLENCGKEATHTYEELLRIGALAW